jgi:hypothetical protein
MLAPILASVGRLELGGGNGHLLALPVGVDAAVESVHGPGQVGGKGEGEGVVVRGLLLPGYHHPELVLLKLERS